MLKNENNNEVNDLEELNNENILEKNSSLIEENKEEKKMEKSKDKISDKKVDEASVIEKIKDFIAKIIAMQEESLKESTDEEEKAGTEKKKKISVRKRRNQTPEYLIEYYDLPYRYNETVVKILAQTPKRMFVYWDISDGDRQKYIETFGEDFFEKTYPVLLLYNEDRKYVKEIPINDFANSWYVDIEDTKNKYTIQLGRKFKNQNEIINIAKVQENNIVLRTDYLPFADSNILEVPNDHVLLNELPEYITFRNVKTNEETQKSTRSFKDVFGNNYDVRDFYNDQYKEEISEGMFDMANPSSNLSSSVFK